RIDGDDGAVKTVPFFGELYRRTTAPLLHPEVTRVEAGFIASTLGFGAGDRVLDLGCGQGRHLARLHGTGATLVGLDFDRESLQEAGRWSRAVQGDLRALPFRTGSFEAIFCWYSTLFVFDEEGNRAALAEAARV